MQRLNQLRGHGGGVTAHRRQIATDAESPARAAHDDGAHAGIGGQFDTRRVKGSGGRNIQRIERVGAIELQDRDGVVAQHLHGAGVRGKF